MAPGGQRPPWAWDVNIMRLWPQKAGLEPGEGRAWQDIWWCLAAAATVELALRSKPGLLGPRLGNSWRL